MALSDHPKIQQIIFEGYEFKMRDYIEKGINLFQKNMGNYVGFILLSGLMMAMCQVIPILGPMAANLILLPALTAGFYKTSREVERGRPAPFAMFFSGFDQIGAFVVIQIVTGLIILASLIPFLVSIFFTGFMSWYFELFSNPEAISDFPGFPFWTLILLLPAFYLSIAYQFAIPFVVFHKMEFWDAMEASRQIVTKRWLWFFLFYIVTGFIAMLGALALLIGLIFSLPAVFCMHYACFSEITRLESPEDENFDISDHLIV